MNELHQHVQGFLPHSYCLLQDPVQVWGQAIAHNFFFLAYTGFFLFAVVVLTTVRGFAESYLIRVIFGIAVFVLLCGITHFMSGVNLFTGAWNIVFLPFALLGSVYSLYVTVRLWRDRQKMIELIHEFIRIYRMMQNESSWQ